MSSLPRLRLAEYSTDAWARVAVIRQPHQADMGSHSHEFVELVVVLSGEGTHMTGSATHPVREGDILVINSSRPHGYKNTKNLNLVNVLIREDVLRRAEREFGQLPGYHALFTLEPMRWRSGGFAHRLRLSPPDLRQVSGWIDALETETQRPDEGGRLLAHAWLMLVIGLLARKHGRKSEESSDMQMRLGRALSLMEQNSSEPLRLERLAREAAMSERTFFRRFREAMGCSPVDYLLRSRIRRAADMLDRAGPRLSVTEIANRCGFDDSNYFSRQFRRFMGKSPRTYRERKEIASPAIIRQPPPRERH